MSNKLLLFNREIVPKRELLEAGILRNLEKYSN